MFSLTTDVILLDMDGVLADWERAFAQAWRAEYPHLPALTQADRYHYFVEKDFRAHHGNDYFEEVDRIIHAPWFFASMLPIGGAREGVAAMQRLGLHVVVCSSPPQNAHAVAEKFAWLERHFGDDLRKHAIMTNDKTLVKGAYLIDDRPEIDGAALPEWQHVVFDAPYNRHVTGRLRMNWESWR